MKDNFGNTKPVQIDLNEWWFNGRIIVKQEDKRLQLGFLSKILKLPMKRKFIIVNQKL